MEINPEWHGEKPKKKCIEKYSVQDDNVVSDPELCKSGQITRDGTNKCVSYKLVNKDCDSTELCSYTTTDGQTQKLHDNCEVKSDGITKACSEINGDLWNKYVKAYQKRLNKIKDDKDYNRHSSKWSEHLGDRDVSDAYVEWQYNVLFSDATDCVKDYFKERETSSSNFLVFNLMVIISFVLILI